MEDFQGEKQKRGQKQEQEQGQGQGLGLGLKQGIGFWQEQREALKQLQAQQEEGRKIVFTNGCFDLLHVGHVRYLQEAAHLGDLLVVGLNSDASVRRLKGPTRPIQSESDRAEILLALSCVDRVFLFEEDTPLELIQQVNPDVLVKGGDWSPDQIVGSHFVLDRGGSVLSLPYVEGRSTTNLIKKSLMKESFKK